MFCISFPPGLEKKYLLQGLHIFAYLLHAVSSKDKQSSYVCVQRFVPASAPPPVMFFFINRYAALEAHVSFLLCGRIVELSDPIFTDATELRAGDYVRLYTPGGNDCVGQGRIVEYHKETGNDGHLRLASPFD